MKIYKATEKKLEKILIKNNFKFDKKIKFKDINIVNNSSVDSLKLLSIITDIEKVFKIKFPINFFKKIKEKNIDYIIKKIIKK